MVGDVSRARLLIFLPRCRRDFRANFGKDAKKSNVVWFEDDIKDQVCLFSDKMLDF